jgi:hypothetical protein
VLRQEIQERMTPIAEAARIGKIGIEIIIVFG